MENVQRFGALIGLTVIFALAVDLIVTPAVLRFFLRDMKLADAGDK